MNAFSELQRFLDSPGLLTCVVRDGHNARDARDIMIRYSKHVVMLAAPDSRLSGLGGWLRDLQLTVQQCETEEVAIDQIWQNAPLIVLVDGAELQVEPSFVSRCLELYTDACIIWLAGEQAPDFRGVRPNLVLDTKTQDLREAVEKFVRHEICPASVSEPLLMAAVETFNSWNTDIDIKEPSLSNYSLLSGEVGALTGFSGPKIAGSVLLIGERGYFVGMAQRMNSDLASQLDPIDLAGEVSMQIVARFKEFLLRGVSDIQMSLPRRYLETERLAGRPRLVGITWPIADQVFMELCIRAVDLHDLAFNREVELLPKGEIHFL